MAKSSAKISKARTARKVTKSTLILFVILSNACYNILTDAAVKKYYARERNDLIKMCMDTLRLMKYILNDPRNEESKGNLIGFVHAIRSVKDDSSKSFRGLRAKPYRRPTKDQNSRDSS